MSVFIVQESTHADHVSRHPTSEEAIAAIEEMIRDGLAEPGDFNVREIDADGTTIRVFPVVRRGSGSDAVSLTERERQVLRLLALGLPNDEIGQRLAISSATVRVHVRKVLAKLQADTKDEAVETARRESLGA
jgi:DNA-binding NarL/FixJ family response regulator